MTWHVLIKNFISEGTEFNFKKYEIPKILGFMSKATLWAWKVSGNCFKKVFWKVCIQKMCGWGEMPKSAGEENEKMCGWGEICVGKCEKNVGGNMKNVKKCVKCEEKKCENKNVEKMRKQCDNSICVNIWKNIFWVLECSLWFGLNNVLLFINFRAPETVK